MRIAQAFKIEKDDFVNECVIAATFVNDSMILAKNRDRNYRPLVEIVNEVRDGVEVMYLHDKLTDWMEGINEFGVAIINSALAVDFDETEYQAFIESGEIQKSYDGFKIRQALTKKTARLAVKSLMEDTYKEMIDDKENRFRVKGHTIVCDGKDIYHLESDGETMVKVKLSLDPIEPVVFTNHGEEMPELGYPDDGGPNRLSTEKRKTIAEEQLNFKTKSRTQILDLLRFSESADKRMAPFRVRPKRGNRMFTTSQTLFDCNTVKMLFMYAESDCEFDGIRKNLPYEKSKIRLKIKQYEIE